MFWADKKAAEIKEHFKSEKNPLVIRDEKTTSGWAHVGSMRSAAMHGVIAEALNDLNVANVYYFESNDFDAMDGIPVYLDEETYKPYLGMPLRDIPAPEGGQAKNLAEYFAEDFRRVIVETGFDVKFYYGSELYLAGKMDEVIREAILGADTIRKIYKEIAKSKKEDLWLPIMIKCPKCGKIATTQASDFDGDTVAFVCNPTKVEWAKGCNHSGRISPFGGNAKLPWKVEWAAKWKVMQVKVEGAGKDHSTKGGSRDVASAISEEVFHYDPPFDSPHEFFLVGGKKISSSKGLGATARAIVDLIPPKIFRLALVGKNIMQAVNFDPAGDSIPVLYDWYDKLAEKYWSDSKDDDARVFVLIHPPKERGNLEKRFLPRFSQVVFLVQMPHMDLYEEVEKMKGAPLTAHDKEELDLRAHYAKIWLEREAPEEYKYEIKKEVPEAARNLNENQKKALKAILDIISKAEKIDGQELHTKLHEVRKELNIEPADFFSGIYLSILGKQSGPKAGWFLSVLDHSFLIRRFGQIVDQV